MPKKIRKQPQTSKKAKNTASYFSQASKIVPPITSNPSNQSIFYEDEEPDAPKPTNLPKLRSRLRPKKEESQPMVKIEEDFQSLDYSQVSSFKIARRSNVCQPIFFSGNFPETDQLDFKIFTQSVARSKIFSVLLVNKYGRIIFSDKLGHQLFEGSLNNFCTARVQNLIMETIRPAALAQLKVIETYNDQTVVNWVIYSKNTKRRYCRVPFNANNAKDTFYRFLKAITVRIRPVKIVFSEYKSVEGFWNTSLMQKGETQFFMLEARPCNKMPDLNISALWNDSTLKKYIRSNSFKASLNIIKIEQLQKEEKEEQKQMIAEQSCDKSESESESESESKSESESVKSCSYSHVSFSEPEVVQCKIEEEISDQCILKLEVQKVRVEPKIKTTNGRGVGLFADISIDDV